MVATRSITWPSSSFVGFDRLWNELDRHLTSGVDHTAVFPKHNVVKVDDENFHIELALAGYSQEDLKIEVQDGTLTITGEKQADEEVEYLHKGISTKKFVRSFRLNENVRVNDANMENGLLRIDLEVVIPEERKPRLIEIGKKLLK